MKMKIAKVREVIDRSDYCRLDLSGHTRDEFMRCNVPEVLGSIIEALKALDLAPRFAADHERRESEIVRCEAVIQRWRGLQGQPLVPMQKFHIN